MRFDQLPYNLQYCLQHVMKAFKNIDFKNYSDDDSKAVEAELLVDAQVVSSELQEKHQWGSERWHYIALDLDVEAFLIPSSSNGHSHLYIPISVSWDKYLKLMEAMADCGILEQAYVSVSKKRKATFLRVPWLKKGFEEYPTIDKIEEFLEA